MSKNVLFYVDECLPIRFYRDILPRIFEITQIVDMPYPISLKSVVEEFGSGAKDMDWIPAVAEELGGKMGLILTADKGRKKRGDKLPELCQAHGIKYALLNSRVQKEGFKAMAMAIWASWNGLYHAATEACNTFHYQIESQQTGKHEVGDFRYRVVRKTKPHS